MEKCNDPEINEFVKGIFKPGAVLVSYGNRGGGKTHCAVSFCQRLIEKYYEGTPKHVILLTNVIFIKKTDNPDPDKTFVDESPPGVHTILSMREIFPIIVESMEKYGRQDTMFILLLDEAQNFLLGDMNNAGEMASSMKKFCGIIRKFNLCLWLLTPAMRNLGPAFRNFLDADTDPANVNTTFQKNNIKAERYIKRRNLNLDPRALVFIQCGANEMPEMMEVPSSSWTRPPEQIGVGDYVYDTSACADFLIGDFPFHEFIQYISGKSSYGLITRVKEFYDNQTVQTSTLIDRDMIEMELKKKLAWKIRDIASEKSVKGLNIKLIGKIFGVSDTTITNWTQGWKPPATEGANKEDEVVEEK